MRFMLTFLVIGFVDLNTKQIGLRGILIDLDSWCVLISHPLNEKCLNRR